MLCHTVVQADGMPMGDVIDMILWQMVNHKHWPYLGKSSATRELGKQDFMTTYRKPPSLKDMYIRAKYIAWNVTGTTLSMWDEQETESLTDSKVTFLTLNTITTPQWQDTLTATVTNWIQR